MCAELVKPRYRTLLNTLSVIDFKAATLHQWICPFSGDSWKIDSHSWDRISGHAFEMNYNFSPAGGGGIHFSFHTYLELQLLTHYRRWCMKIREFLQSAVGRNCLNTPGSLLSGRSMPTIFGCCFVVLERGSLSPALEWKIYLLFR